MTHFLAFPRPPPRFTNNAKRILEEPVVRLTVFKHPNLSVHVLPYVAGQNGVYKGPLHVLTATKKATYNMSSQLGVSNRKCKRVHFQIHRDFRLTFTCAETHVEINLNTRVSFQLWSTFCWCKCKYHSQYAPTKKPKPMMEQTHSVKETWRSV